MSEGHGNARVAQSPHLPQVVIFHQKYSSFFDGMNGLAEYTKAPYPRGVLQG